MHLCNHYHNQDTEYFHIPRKAPHLPYPAGVFFLVLSIIWNHLIHDFFSLFPVCLHRQSVCSTKAGTVSRSQSRHIVGPQAIYGSHDIVFILLVCAHPDTHVWRYLWGKLLGMELLG